ncbi:MAG TPA: filamentous hemagglutinin N-terminal domain-containing protein [Arsenophonus sp.]
MNGEYFRDLLEKVLAKIIINEVTSTERNLLNEKLTVNGKAAELVIANPYGIECDGCSTSGISVFTLQSKYTVPVLMTENG